MRKLPKQKRTQLIMVGLITALALAGLWFGLVGLQKASLTRIADETAAANRKLAEMKSAIASAQQIESELEQEAKLLDKHEQKMATGDLYAWAINTIRAFKLSHKVEVPQFSQIEGPRDVNLLTDFPYKQASLTIGGTGHYFEIGQFIADFENSFPHARLCNLSLEPSVSLQGADREKLLFKMDIVFLVKPTGI